MSLTLCVNVFASIAVIIHPENNNAIDAQQIRSIYLSKTRTFESGDKANPIDVKDNDDLRDKFSKALLRKSPSSLNSYWSRMIFSAKGRPPEKLSMSAVKAKVASDKLSIGYIDETLVDDSVKVVFRVE